MNYLLDTHIFLWVLAEPERLHRKVLTVLEDPTHTVAVSAVTSIEIAIKSALGKLEAPAGLHREIAARGFRELPIHYSHGEILRTLPPYHADPFDRMLVAQAVEDGLTLISHDKKLAPYPVKILWT